MNPDQEDLVRWLASLPGGRHPLDRAAFARLTGIADPSAWAAEELSGAVVACDAGTAELVLVVGVAFGVDHRWIGPLIDLLAGSWHELHEQSVIVLGSLRAPEAVSTLYDATQWVPDYLAHDEERSLALTAVRALGAIPGDDATRALELVLHDADDTVAACAGRQLERRLA